MIVGWNHICLPVSDIDATKRFYCDVLGFRQGPEFVSEKGKPWGGYLYINRRVFIEYLQSKEPVTPFEHFCLEVDDLRATLDTLHAAGITATNVYLGRSKAWIASLKDPDGHVIELNEFSHPESWIRHFLAEIESEI